MYVSVSREQYFRDIDFAVAMTKGIPFDAIVCLKRSGFIMGVRLSHKLGLILFTTSEIPSIPKHFKRILLVDDKCWRGRQFRKFSRQLQVAGKLVKTLCLYVEGEIKTDLYVQNMLAKVRPFYEI